MRIDEFAEKVGENRRQIRYLISEGFVPAPDGSTNGASYGMHHEDAVRRYQTLREQGLRPSEIRNMMTAAPVLDVSYAPGVRLLLDTGAPGWSDIDASRLAEWVVEQFKALQPAHTRKENQHAV